MQENGESESDISAIHVESRSMNEYINGNGDAIRHVLWNYGMAIDVGDSYAKQWAYAHENGTANNPTLEKNMDMFNNRIARYQYKVHGNPGSIAGMIKIVKNRVSSGGCQVIRNNKIVNSDTRGQK